MTQAFLEQYADYHDPWNSLLDRVVGIECNCTVWPADSAAGSIFYTMTASMLSCTDRGDLPVHRISQWRKGIYTAERHWAVEASAVYWHFVMSFGFSSIRLSI